MGCRVAEPSSFSTYLAQNLSYRQLRAAKDRIRDSKETDLSRIRERAATARGVGRSRVDRSAKRVERFVFSQKMRQRRVDTPDDAAFET